MLEYIHNNMPGFWVALGFALLAAEVLLFGFTTIIFLFAGIGALITGILMMLGIIPETWIAGIASFGIASGVSTLLLWKPMMLMQGKSAAKQKKVSDFIGLEFVLIADISTVAPGSYRYSGMNWTVEIDRSSELEAIAKGTRVVVVEVQVGVLCVIKK